MSSSGSDSDGAGRVPGHAGDLSRPARVTRRRALQLGATGSLAVAGPLAAVGPASARARADVEDAKPGRLEQSFDEGWLFYRGDASGAEQVSFDDGTWRALDLPHDWSIEDLPYATSAEGGVTADPSLLVPKVPSTQPVPPPMIGPFDENNSVGDGSVGYTIGGIGWYRKHFTLHPGATGIERRIELRFDGVYQNADVWLNGVHLGFHPYGYTPFSFDITPHLNRDGTNILSVRVDNSGKTSRWYSGSGIYRHTWLTITNAIRIPLWGICVTTPVVGEQSQAYVEVSVANLSAGQETARVRVTVLGPHGQVVAVSQSTSAAIAPGTTAVLPVDVPIRGATLWSPHAPSLYTAVAEVLAAGAVADRVATTFGIRSLEWNGTDGFLLNGKPVKMVGGCVHDTHGPFGASPRPSTRTRPTPTRTRGRSATGSGPPGTTSARRA
jgi:beta-galactosidase